MPATSTARALMERWFTAFNTGEVADLWAIHDPSCRNHAPGPFDLSPWPSSGKAFGPEAAAATITWLRTNMPDLTVEIEQVVAQDDQVVAWIRATGTPSGDGPLPATGRRVNFSQAHRFRISPEGRIVEHWAVRDDLRSLLQTGAQLTAPPVAATRP